MTGSQELVAPVGQGSGAVERVLPIPSGHVPEPHLEKFEVLLQNQELAEHDVGLVEAGLRQLGGQDGSDPGQLGDGLVTHRLGHELPVLLGSGRRCCGGCHSEICKQRFAPIADFPNADISNGVIFFVKKRINKSIFRSYHKVEEVKPLSSSATKKLNVNKSIK